MPELLVPFVVSLAVTVVGVPVVRRVLLARHVLDLPNARSSHAAPVARGGGIACAAGVLAAVAVASASGTPVPWALVGVALLLSGVGLADDLVRLPAVPRLAAQAVGGAAAGWLLGRGVVAALGGAVLAVLLVNVVNFMDGINGISGLVMVVWGGATAVAGVRADSTALAVLGLVTGAAALAFLPFNAPVAQVFLGDSGSYLFGGLVSVGVLLAWQQGAALGLVLAPVALYLADVLSTLARRGLRREPLMQAHRDHAYQRITALGVPHGRVSLAVAGAALVATAAWGTGPPLLAALVTAVVVLGYLFAPGWLARRRPVAALGGHA